MLLKQQHPSKSTTTATQEDDIKVTSPTTPYQHQAQHPTKNNKNTNHQRTTTASLPQQQLHPSKQAPKDNFTNLSMTTSMTSTTTASLLQQRLQPPLNKIRSIVFFVQSANMSPFKYLSFRFKLLKIFSKIFIN